MPNLLGATPDSDRADFARLWDDPALRPDELKIYPCSLIANTELYQRWQNGEYRPYTDQELIDLVVDCKTHVPPYCRINRVMRDIASRRRRLPGRTARKCSASGARGQRCQSSAPPGARKVSAEALVLQERLTTTATPNVSWRLHGAGRGQAEPPWRDIAALMPREHSQLEEIAGAPVRRCTSMARRWKSRGRLSNDRCRAGTRLIGVRLRCAWAGFDAWPWPRDRYAEQSRARFELGELYMMRDIL
jgi:hypothetical protein